MKLPGKYQWNELPWMKFPQALHFRLPILNLSLHSHNITFRLHKLLKVIYTFSYKIKPTKLKNKPYLW